MKRRSIYNSILFILLLPSFLYAQPPVIKYDTAFYNRPTRAIQSITETEGNKKTITYYDHNGSKQSRENYINNILEGKFARWYPNGQYQEEITYSKSNVLKRKEWYQSGILHREQNYKLIYKLVKKDTAWQSQFDGKYVENYPTGLPANIGMYRNGKKEGEWITYYEIGDKNTITNYKDGFRDGTARSWYKSGQLAWEFRYTTLVQNGNPREVRQGKQISYFENGKPSEKSNYNMGKREGLYEDWYENGNRKTESEYKNEIINGKNNLWFPNGKVRQVMNFVMVYDSVKRYSSPRYEGKYEIYFESGNLQKSGNYINGKEDGMFVEFNENGRKSSERYYIKGLQTGKDTKWHRNGNIYQVQNYAMKKVKDTTISVLEGESRGYSENNVLTWIGNYKNNKKEGLWQSWYQDNIKADETNYCEELRCGKSTQWNNNGTLKMEQEFKIISNNGIKESALAGEEKRYDINGKLERKGYYTGNNNCYQTEEFYPDGTLRILMSHLIKSDNYYPSTGSVNTWFSNGQSESESFNFNGTIIGRNVKYYINGNLKSIEDLNGNGRKSGFEIQWSSDGEVSSFRKYMTYSDFENVDNTSLAKSIFDSYVNRPKSHGSMVNGKREGVWISWFDATHKQFEGNYKNGKPDGLFMAFYPDGSKLFDIEMEDALANGKFILWSNKGKALKVGHFTNGERTGTWINYFESGNKEEELGYEVGYKQYVSRKDFYENGNQKSETGYRNGREYGHFRFWYENGQLSSESERLDGMMSGVLKEYYPDGKPKSVVTYQHNQKEGLETRWYESGNMDQKVNHKDGKRHGKYTLWWATGNIRMDGYYVMNEMDSTWKTYLENGILEKTQVYKKGILLREPSGFECECIDSIKTNVGYAAPVSSLATLDKIRKMSFNFHAPVGDFYDKLYYINLQTSNSRNSTWWSFDMLAYKQTYLRIPDSNGLKLVLNPCFNVAGVGTKINVSLSTEKNNKDRTRLSLYPKSLGIEFNPQLLHQWNMKTASPYHGNPDSKLENDTAKFLPAMLLFKSSEIEYTNDGLTVSGIQDPCFATAEIGNTGILLNFDDMILDVDVSKNPDAFDGIPGVYADKLYDAKNYFEKYYPDILLDKFSYEKFTGVFVPEAQITLPDVVFSPGTKKSLTVRGENFILGGSYLLGTIHIKALLWEEMNTKVEPTGVKSDLNAESVEKYFSSRGIKKIKAEYDNIASEFIVYFYYEIN